MMNLVAALTVALQSVVGTGHGVASPARIKVVSEDIVDVVREDFESKKLKSTIAFKDAVAMLAAAATHESGLRVSVENCYHTGDGGRSVGLGQVIKGPNWEGHTKEQICSSRKLQLKLALHVLDRCWEGTPNHEAAFRCYAAGDAKKFSWSSRNQHLMFKKIREGLDKDIVFVHASSILANPKLRFRNVKVAAILQADHSRPKVIVKDKSGHPVKLKIKAVPVGLVGDKPVVKPAILIVPQTVKPVVVQSVVVVKPASAPVTPMPVAPAVPVTPKPQPVVPVVSTPIVAQPVSDTKH